MSRPFELRLVFLGQQSINAGPPPVQMHVIAVVTQKGVSCGAVLAQLRERICGDELIAAGVDIAALAEVQEIINEDWAVEALLESAEDLCGKWDGDTPLPWNPRQTSEYEMAYFGVSCSRALPRA
jgi:hypothetical protein